MGLRDDVADITYIPLAKGFLYLVAIMDWWSRKVLAWRPPACLLGRAGSTRQGWVSYYNHRRPHAARGGDTPFRVYRERLSASGPGLRRPSIRHYVYSDASALALSGGGDGPLFPSDRGLVDKLLDDPAHRFGSLTDGGRCPAA
jgi:hypothetical protein